MKDVNNSVLSALYSDSHIEPPPLLDINGCKLPPLAPDDVYFAARVIQVLVGAYNISREEAQEMVKSRQFMLPYWVNNSHPVHVARRLAQGVQF